MLKHNWAKPFLVITITAVVIYLIVTLIKGAFPDKTFEKVSKELSTPLKDVPFYWLIILLLLIIPSNKSNNN